MSNEDKEVSTNDRATTQESGKRHLLKGRYSRSKKIALALSVFLVVSVVVLLLFGDSRNENIIIGDTEITRKDIDKYDALVQKMLKSDPAKKIEGDPREDAINRLVLNAALKNEAKKLDVKVTDDDIANALERSFQDKDEQDKYINQFKQNYRAFVDLENKTYQLKLEDKLITKKNLTVVNVMFDTPYFKKLTRGDVQVEYTKAKKRLNNELMPLIKSGASKEEIAKHTDTIWYDENKDDGNQDLFLYMDGPVTAVDTITGYMKGVTTFNDIDDTNYINGNVGKLFGTANQIDSLRKVGDYTDVFAGKTGGFFIMRLDSKTSGSYDSWDDMLYKYKKQYVDGKLDIAINAARSGIMGAANFTSKMMTSPGLDKAWAQIDDATCRGHYANFTVVAVDAGDNRRLSGAKISSTRRASDTVIKDGVRRSPAQLCGAVGTFYAVSDGGYTPTGPVEGWNRTGGDGNNNDRTMHDSCWNTPPELNVVAHPSGWNGSNWDGRGVDRRPLKWGPGQDGNVYKSKDTYNPSTTNNGWPTWNSANTNETDYYIILKYEEVDWGEDEPPVSDFNAYCTKPDEGTYEIYGNVEADLYYRVFDGYVNSTRVLQEGQSNGSFSFERTNGVAYFGHGTMERIFVLKVYERSDFTREVSSAGDEWKGFMDCAPYNWSLTQSTTADPWIEQGGSANFGHTITNSGPDTAKFDASLGYYYDPANPDAGVRAWEYGPTTFVELANGSSLDMSNVLTVGTPALGTSLCQVNGAAPYASNVSVGRASDHKCIKVVGGRTTLSAPAGVSSIEPGGQASFTVSLATSSLTTEGTWVGYNVDCSYDIAIVNEDDSVADRIVDDAECDHNVRQASATTSPNRTINLTRSVDSSIGMVGKRICIQATIHSAIGGGGADNLNFTVNRSSGELTDNCTEIVARPYLKVYGSDVSVGGGVGACDNSDSIVSWNKGSGGSYAGAGAQFAAIARGPLFGFTGAQGVVSSGVKYAAKPQGLNFSNVGIGSSVSNNLYGGTFRGACDPVKDYFKEAPPLAGNSWTDLATATATPSLHVKKYRHNGDLTLALNSTMIPKGNNIALYIDGDLKITGDRIYADSSVDKIQDVPLLMVVVTGNIYVSNTVDELYGTYIAQPKNSSTGNISTCANTGPTPAQRRSSMAQVGATNPDYSLCNRKLTVNGSFVAKSIFLDRTHGSQFSADGANDIDHAAEVFQYNPLVWMRQSSAGNIDGDFKLDSVTSLPPVL